MDWRNDGNPLDDIREAIERETARAPREPAVYVVSPVALRWARDNARRDGNERLVAEIERVLAENRR